MSVMTSMLVVPSNDTFNRPLFVTWCGSMPWICMFLGLERTPDIPSMTLVPAALAALWTAISFVAVAVPFTTLPMEDGKLGILTNFGAG